MLAARVAGDSWQRLLAGEVVESGRPSGPLWGRGRSAAAADALALETAALAPHAALCEALEHAGLRQDRRTLELVPDEFHWRAQDDDLVVGFRLPPGGYATVLLGELAELEQPARAA